MGQVSLSVLQESTHLLWGYFYIPSQLENLGNTEKTYVQKPVESLGKVKKYITCAKEYLSMYRCQTTCPTRGVDKGV